MKNSSGGVRQGLLGGQANRPPLATYHFGNLALRGMLTYKQSLRHECYAGKVKLHL
jgi:hypothetical protein